ncbi:MAG: hypothetical protein RIM23_11380 [Coleofasciculus sp. G3-WIS-01]|uniref:hypothetical protein n=1 Tax=Coleofasciculus sp. G3-WIS-01 TaxID=3069528 RepID=UPI0032FFEEBB
MSFTTFDPRTLGTPVYEALTQLRSRYDQALADAKISNKVYRNHLKEQKNQAVELYTYLSTWGLMRLRAEEIALCNVKPPDPHPDQLSVEKKAARNQEGKREVIQEFFRCLETLSLTPNLTLDQLKVSAMNTDDYLGLTGLGLAVAQEFSFWASVVYPDISGQE